MAETDSAKKADDKIPLVGVTSADERREAILKEYGKYVAVVRITTANGAGAFNPGDPIPTSTIERDDLTAGVGLTGHWLTADSEAVALRSSAKGQAALRAAGETE